MRQIILDTETTGIGHEQGHRLIEIGCIEMIDRELTGRHFHQYLNPERAIDEGAFKVHGISNEFLEDKPFFKDIFQELLTFIEGAELIIHNAAFDVGFLDAELGRLTWPKKIIDYCQIFDTLALAKKKHPGQRNNLDALCKRYEIDNSNRTLHGALLDAEILASVYLAMTGGQGRLFEEETVSNSAPAAADVFIPNQKPSHVFCTPVILPTPEELARHETFMADVLSALSKK